MEKAINDAIIEAVSRRVAEKLHEDFTASWGIVLSELAKTRESNENLQGKVSVLEQRVNGQNTQLQNTINGLVTELQKTRENQRKAAEVLDAALKEMGVGE